ncbi:GNAT family N-acetyltransferase [Pseudonocardia acaciae]|uniref:GNAT family N-acetyltransferase n=1 Tax=Pseudonocardia acaciae TaxID=551276 RepID=UPI000683F5A3|nr:GNAT family N-acetyltransferase [Pseudonocardia acaciae]
MGLFRLHVQIEDRPGRLAELAAAVAGAGCNIVSLTVLGERGPDGSVTDELLVDAADQATATSLADQIRAAGMGCTLAVRADADELRDPVTTALALARRVAGDPDAAPRAMASLLHATLQDTPPLDADAHAHQMRVFGQDVRLCRGWPFTATEVSRAAVLVELAELCAAASDRPDPADEPGSLGLVLLGNGSEVELRVATLSDGPLVAALHARCTPSTRHGRFLNPSPALSSDELAELLVGASGDGVALLALTPDGGHAVGLATLDPDGAGGAALGVLVEDAWQARGVGTALVRRAVELATESGWSELSAFAHPGNLRITRLLRRSGLRPTARLVDGLLEVHVALPQHAVTSP